MLSYTSGSYFFLAVKGYISVYEQCNHISYLCSEIYFKCKSTHISRMRICISDSRFYIWIEDDNKRKAESPSQTFFYNQDSQSDCLYGLIHVLLFFPHHSIVWAGWANDLGRGKYKRRLEVLRWLFMKVSISKVNFQEFFAARQTI